MARIGFSQSSLAKFAGPEHWNDPDMLEVGNGGMSVDEYKTHFSLWSMAAAPLIAGNDLRTMDADIKSILLNKEVIAVDQDPLGKSGSQVSENGTLSVWTKPLATGDLAVGLFNRGNIAAEANVSRTDLHLSGKHAVRDLWEHSDRGDFAEVYTTSVPAHGVVMILVSH
jgi:alpha-galactosidase